MLHLRAGPSMKNRQSAEWRLGSGTHFSWTPAPAGSWRPACCSACCTLWPPPRSSCSAAAGTGAEEHVFLHFHLFKLHIILIGGFRRKALEMQPNSFRRLAIGRLQFEISCGKAQTLITTICMACYDVSKKVMPAEEKRVEQNKTIGRNESVLVVWFCVVGFGHESKAAKLFPEKTHINSCIKAVARANPTVALSTVSFRCEQNDAYIDQISKNPISTSILMLLLLNTSSYVVFADLGGQRSSVSSFAPTHNPTISRRSCVGTPTRANNYLFSVVNQKTNKQISVCVKTGPVGC